MTNLTSPSFPNGAQCDRSEADYRRSKDMNSLILSMVNVIELGAVKLKPQHKPCPWCACDVALPRQVFTRWVVGCENDDCGVTAEASGITPEEALKLWNGRA